MRDLENKYALNCPKPEDFKLFGSAYKLRKRILDNLFEKLSRISPEKFPEELLDYYNNSAHKSYIKDGSINASLKLALLRYSKEYHDAELQFLGWFLTFVKPEQFQNQRTVTNVIDLFKETRKHNRNLSRMGSLFFNDLNRFIKHFHPPDNVARFNKNSKALLSQIIKVMKPQGTQNT